MSELAVTDLPEPDSPTMASVLPRSSVKLTPSTALAVPAAVWKYVRRSRTSTRRSEDVSAPCSRASALSRTSVFFVSLMGATSSASGRARRARRRRAG